MAKKILIKIILFILLNLIYCACTDLTLLHRREGIVGRENFTYYKLKSPNAILLILKSLEGDADIYVSQKSTVTYEPEMYDLHSATCGIDIVEIPKDFEKPVTVGIYGHPSFEESYFTLDIYDLPNESEETAQVNVEQFEVESEKPKKVNQEKIEKERSAKIKSYAARSGIWALLEIMQLVFI